MARFVTCMTAMAWVAGTRLSAGMIAIENAKNTPAIRPSPTISAQTKAGGIMPAPSPA
jgi:hypothetical protein